MKWIKVKDKLPKVGENLLVLLKPWKEAGIGFGIMNDNHDKSRKYWSVSDAYGNFHCGYNIVSHWMYLPENPS